MGNGYLANKFLHEAVPGLYQDSENENILDILKLILDLNQPWNHANNDIFLSVLLRLPGYLSRKDEVDVFCKAGYWDAICLQDLTNQKTCKVFRDYWNNVGFKRIIRMITDCERSQVEQLLPWAQADFQYDGGNHFEAIKTLFKHRDYESAADLCNRYIQEEQRRLDPSQCHAIVQCWADELPNGLSAIRKRKNDFSLLLSLFDDPRKAAMSPGSILIDIFGREVIRAAFKSALLDEYDLLLFRDSAFNDDGLRFLENKFAPNNIQVVQKLVRDGYHALAEEYAEKKDWKNDNLVQLTELLRNQPSWLLKSAEDREWENSHLLQLVKARSGYLRHLNESGIHIRSWR